MRPEDAINPPRSNADILLEKFHNMPREEKRKLLYANLEKIPNTGGFIIWEQIDSRKWDPDAEDENFHRGMWVPREADERLSDIDKAEIENLLLLLSQIHDIDPHTEFLAKNHYFNANDYTYVDATKSQAYKYGDYRNYWSFRGSCVGAIFRMPDETRKQFITEMLESINNNEGLRNRYSAIMSTQEQSAQEPKVPTLKVEKKLEGTNTSITNTIIITIPITDHPLIATTITIDPQISPTQIGTLNVWCPGTRMANSVSGAHGLGAEYRLPDNHHQEQMEKLAKYIIDSFKCGISLLALQEIPNPTTKNFEILERKLKEFSAKDRVQINVDDLKKRWLPTQSGFFGTSILVNPAHFKVHAYQQSPSLGNRAAEYTIEDVQSQKTFQLMNFHAEFNNAAQYSKINEAYGKGKICLGDTNSEVRLIPNDPQSASIQAVNNNLRTYDVILVPKNIAVQAVVTTSAAAASSTQQGTVLKPAIIPPFELDARSNIISLTLKDDNGTLYYLAQYADKNNTPTATTARIYSNNRLTNGNGTRELDAGSPLKAKIESILKHFHIPDVSISASLQQQCTAVVAQTPQIVDLNGINVTSIMRETDGQFKINGIIPGGQRAARELYIDSNGVCTRSRGTLDLSPEHLTMKNNLSTIFDHFKNTLSSDAQTICAAQFALVEYKPTTAIFGIFGGASKESNEFVNNMKNILASKESDKDKAAKIQMEINKTKSDGALHTILEKYDLRKTMPTAAVASSQIQEKH